MSSQISLSTLTKKSGEKKAATKDASSVATSKPPLKEIVIQETPMTLRPPKRVKWMILRARKPCPPKRTKSNKGASNVVRRPLVPGDPSTSLGDSLGPRVSMMSSAPVAQKILSRVILPADKEKVDQFSMDQLVTKPFHALGQVLCYFSFSFIHVLYSYFLAFTWACL